MAYLPLKIESVHRTWEPGVSDYKLVFVSLGFSMSNYTNDISILKLCDPLPLYDYPNIKPACLPSFKYSGPAIVSGWGSLYSGGMGV